MSRSRSLLRSEGSFVSSVVTLLNSTVGVVVLAMPYCFQQCGVLLSIMFIAFSAFCCYAACNILIKLCLTHKISSIEKACFRHLGLLGKLVTELSIVGLMLGYITGYDVSISDLGMGIMNQLLTVTSQSHSLRFCVLGLITVLIFPLCLMPRVQSMAKFSAFAVFVYTVVMFHMIFILGLPKLAFSAPFTRMSWWRPIGLLQCAPIFFASIFCQTQLHTIYAGLPDPSVSTMRRIVRTVVTAIALAYSLFGFFGYAAFVDSGEITGNIFIMYPKNEFSFLVKTGFLFTITISIPLILFPLRQSLNSFLCHQTPSLSTDLEAAFEGSLPMRRFRWMTFLVVVFCFLLSLTTDRIEVIIQITSSLAGSLVGYILPALATIYAYSYHNRASDQSRRISFGLLAVGLLLLVSGLLSARTVPVTVKPTSTLDRIDIVHVSNDLPKSNVDLTNGDLLQIPVHPSMDIPKVSEDQRIKQVSQKSSKSDVNPRVVQRSIDDISGNHIERHVVNNPNDQPVMQSGQKAADIEKPHFVDPNLISHARTSLNNLPVQDYQQTKDASTNLSEIHVDQPTGQVTVGFPRASLPVQSNGQPSGQSLSSISDDQVVSSTSASLLNVETYTSGHPVESSRQRHNKISETHSRLPNGQQVHVTTVLRGSESGTQSLQKTSNGKLSKQDHRLIKNGQLTYHSARDAPRQPIDHKNSHGPQSVGLSETEFPQIQNDRLQDHLSDNLIPSRVTVQPVSSNPVNAQSGNSSTLNISAGFKHHLLDEFGQTGEVRGLTRAETVRSVVEPSDGSSLSNSTVGRQASEAINHSFTKPRSSSVAKPVESKVLKTTAVQ